MGRTVYWKVKVNLEVILKNVRKTQYQNISKLFIKKINRLQKYALENEKMLFKIW